jgi:hypothetical protein
MGRINKEFMMKDKKTGTADLLTAGSGCKTAHSPLTGNTT